MTRKSIRRFLPLTYIPKIAAVRGGTCMQSIRVDTDLRVGDFVAFHGWSGIPYHSSWSFRTPYCELVLAEPINIHENSIYFPGEKKSLNFEDPQLDLLASKDGIEPATGKELIRVLHAMHGPGILYGKILRWDPAPIRELALSAAIMCSEPISREETPIAETKTITIASIHPFEFEPVSPLEFQKGAPNFNRSLFQKIRAIEQDLKHCSQEADS